MFLQIVFDRDAELLKMLDEHHLPFEHTFILFRNSYMLSRFLQNNNLSRVLNKDPESSPVVCEWLEACLFR